MYFKKLEIVGFKSFMNKTKLKFEPGVTAVVGPNGCGKSNIVDAVKWVLGEQSAKSMRSSAMQDVIFNGTDKYEPLNIAEVSLTLSNEDRILPLDYDEVIISRRLYRSGESEYLLNKTPVRLADVRNILMGTGLGTSSYSIVEQGKMDMILSSKPEERRYIFEEASGITRYKSKKREAMLKLERTRENLTRISDIIREIERQINSIERKARKAERYKARYEELKDLDIRTSYRKFRELSTDDASLGAENCDMKQLTETLSAELERSTSSLAGLREEFAAVIEGLQGEENEVMHLAAEMDKNEHVIRVNKERIQELRKEVERLDWEIEEATGRKEGLRVRLDTQENRFAEVSRKRQARAEALDSAEENVKGLTEKIEKYKAEMKADRERTVDIVSEQTKTKNMSIRMNADIQNAQSREKRLRMEKGSVHTEKENVEVQLRTIEEQAERARTELEEKKIELRIFNEEYAANQQKLLSLKNEKGRREKRLNEIIPRRQFLEKLVADREGITESVKKIMERAEEGDPRFSGVHGILSELINVRGDYEESLESVLGDAAQAVVVDSRETAERVVSYLMANSMGSVNFFLIDELERMMDKGPNIKKGILDDITHILAAKEPYRSALRVFLRDTFVTVSSEAAGIFVNENTEFEGRIIGEKGEIYRKGMCRSRNYSDKEVIPLFGRREKVEQMREEEGRIGGEINGLSADIKELEEWLKRSALRKEEMETQLREKQVDFTNASSRKAAVREKFNSLVEEFLLLETEIEEERDTITRLQEEKKEIDRILERLEAENFRLQELIEQAQNGIQDCSRRREETLYCMSDIKAELFALRKEEENLAENLEREKESCLRMERSVEEKRARINESGKRIKALEEEMKVREERNLEHSASIEVKNRDISGKKERKDALTGAIGQEEQKVKQKERELENFRNKTRDLDIRAKELEYKRNGLVEKVLDAYKVNIAEMDQELDENTDWENVSRRIEELREQLEKMGDVSLGAVEEYKQLEERYLFLTRQRDDLTRGRESLMQAIQKINRTTRKLFMETFENIRKEFNDYFRMLFNGGKAELVLEDESNVLECGIDIVVRPPGKKLHNIMQLSGGEKAMTAIALIFAIFKVNPSPFCILDEIDAPLDESNIVRFCRVLQEFLKLSQFVIVTHNRMTIQLADILYGITMEEKGVSKIVSVKFTEEKEVSDKEAVPVTA
ncbi:MAG: chromosome segregation protein SMC [Candidatus Omnitrophota bacterium]|nr:chromosome segregation protein SMC [Candidatus Omnitrophota bacterium]